MSAVELSFNFFTSLWRKAKRWYRHAVRQTNEQTNKPKKTIESSCYAVLHLESNLEILFYRAYINTDKCICRYRLM